MDEKKKQQLLIEMVMRQTNYTYGECEKKLSDNNNDYMKVIKDYYGVKEKKEEVVSVNQGIIKEIRKMMDNASNNYRITQKIKEEREKQLNRLKKQNKMKPVTNLNKIEEEDEIPEKKEDEIPEKKEDEIPEKKDEEDEIPEKKEQDINGDII
tara:strand:+ start:4379 stop:4837 length:459 start_codon:yes stop_codon:yes gene_type:complete